jgi:aminoglycoside phosphotransferase (APT) family kinase protein
VTIVAVPDSFADVDATWLGEVLGMPVHGVLAEPFAEDSAFLGRLARIHAVHDAAEVPSTFVLKLPTSDPGGRAVGRLLDAWRREALFYEHLADQVSGAVPVAYYVGADPERDRWAILLADLHPWTAGDQVAGATAEQAAAAVDQLARLHAHWWDPRRSAATGWVVGVDRPGVGRLQDAVLAALPRFEDRYGDRLPTAPTEWLRAFAPTLRAYLQSLAEGPLTIAHADYRVENLLFSPEGDQVAVVDWQTAMVTHGATDLTFFVATCLTVEQRHRSEADLVARYQDGLHRHGVPRAQTASVPQVHRAAHLWWMAMLANNLSTIEPPTERGRVLFDTMLQRLWTAADDHEAGALL